MQHSTQNDLQRMIEQYSSELLSQYRAAPKAETVTSTTLPEPIDKSSQTDTDLTDSGFLQVRVSTEDQAVPIPNAIITVRHNFGNGNFLDSTLITDKSGLTPTIELVTKDPTLSLTPGNPAPYTEYTVEVNATGYFTKIFERMPIYGGVTAIQNVSMIPLPEFGTNDSPIVYDEMSPSTL